MFDRLPTPFGLVRAGVAPDHPKIKSVTRVYEKTAAKPGFRFFGNVDVGEDMTHAELKERYHAVIYAVGAQTDRSMGIPGEDLPGSWAATEFVAWYNGHPDFRDLEFDLSLQARGGDRQRQRGDGRGADARAAARGAGGHRHRRPRHRAPWPSSAIEEVVIIGRRGPAQAAFTNPELLELGELTEADVIVDPAEVELDDHSARSIEGEGEITPRRNVEILTELLAARARGQAQAGGAALPALARGDQGGRPRSRRSSSCATSSSTAATAGCAPSPRASTRRWRSGWCSARSATAGCRSRACRSTSGTASIPNEEGRVLDPHEQRAIPGEYVVGWIKRGPSGVIGTNKRDAQETVDHVLEDLAEGRLPEPADTDSDVGRGAGGRAQARLRVLRRLGGDRRRREGGRRAARAARG